MRKRSNEQFESMKAEDFEEECLKNVNRYFELLGLEFRWNNFTKFIDTYKKDQKNNVVHYYDKTLDTITFFSQNGDGIEYSQGKYRPNDYCGVKYPRQYFDDKIYAVAAICYDYIISVNQKAYELKQKDKNMLLTLQREDFVSICNHFSIALGSTRRYQSSKDIIWKSWIPSWSNNDYQSICFSNCSGNCTPFCNGATCLYYFESKEFTENHLLPDNERADERNIFDDKLFWLASQFYNYVQENNNILQKNLF